MAWRDAEARAISSALGFHVLRASFSPDQTATINRHHVASFYDKVRANESTGRSRSERQGSEFWVQSLNRAGHLAGGHRAGSERREGRRMGFTSQGQASGCRGAPLIASGGLCPQSPLLLAMRPADVPAARLARLCGPRLPFRFCSYQFLLLIEIISPLAEC